MNNKSANIIEDNVDTILDKQEGVIKRDRDPKLCRHGTQSKCPYCLPIDPFDENYLSSKDIKHMSFHSYLRKFKIHGKSTTMKFPLENILCRIKPGCTTHPPWPEGICTKCQPNAVTLNRQRYRHVDNISFENELLVSHFLDYYRKSGHQRIGFLLGYYEQHNDVPLGIKAVVAAIYEPPQTSTSEMVQLLDDPKSDVVDKLCQKFGLRRVGWIFTDLVPDEKNRTLVKCTRNADSYMLSAEECITAAYFQSKFPSVCKYSSDGTFGSKFATVIVAGDQNQQIQLFGYQVSNQCSALVADNCLVPTKDAPELAYARESTSEQYIPDVYFTEKDKYGNEVTKIGRPLPVEYLLVDVPAGMPKEPTFTFYANSNRKQFPVENRMALGELQNLTAFGSYVKQFRNEEFLDMISNFHLLLFLLTNETIHFNLEDLTFLLDAIKRKDKNLAIKWSEKSPDWSTLGHIINEQGTSNDAISSTSMDTSSHHEHGKDGWPCPHCTFLNRQTSHDCEVCGLPKQ